MSTELKLLPCPFCGSPGQKSMTGNAKCSNFDCRLWNVHFVDSDWNTRSTPEQVKIPNEDQIKEIIFKHFLDKSEARRMWLVNAAKEIHAMLTEQKGE